MEDMSALQGWEKRPQRLKTTKLHVTVLQEQTRYDISTKKRQQPQAISETSQNNSYPT